MLSKSKIHTIHALRRKKRRDERGLFIAEGDKIVREILQSPNAVQMDAIFALSTWAQEANALLKKYTPFLTIVSESELKQISGLSEPNQVLVIAHKRIPHLSDDVIKQKFTLYLDGIQDPGNMGAILRIADWFGIPCVFCSDTCVDVWNPKVVQSTMGALLRVNTIEISFSDLKKKYPNMPIYGALLKGNNIFEKKCFEKTGIIIIGNEGNGISNELLKQIDFPITIPGGGGAESLNAAVATGIICAFACQAKLNLAF
jgi:TrmH family RNA methyltransferase